MKTTQPKYYYLKKGDIVKDGDEVLGPEDGAKWGPAKGIRVHREAPDPQYITHCNYRRLIGKLPPSEMTVIIRDDGPLIHAEGSPSRRVVAVPLTEEQREMLALNITSKNGVTPIFEVIDSVVIEDAKLETDEERRARESKRSVLETLKLVSKCFRDCKISAVAFAQVSEASFAVDNSIKELEKEA